MQIEEAIVAEGVDISSKPWQFALKNMYVNVGVDVRSMDFFKCQPCIFAKSTNIGKSVIKDTPGYIVGSGMGIMIICPRENDFPVTEWISKKDIRVVQAESKLFKHQVSVKTTNIIYIFKTDKEKVSEIETLVDKVRSK